MCCVNDILGTTKPSIYAAFTRKVINSGGVGFIIPTLFSWNSSVVVLDIKKENWSITSGFRKQYSHVICFDPTSPEFITFTQKTN